MGKTDDKVTALRDLGAAPPGGYRTPPHNYEAEQALLGACLENNAVLEEVGEYLRPEHFAEALHGKIFAAVTALVRQGRVADMVTLANFFESDGELAGVGGAKYLARLVGSVVTIINAPDYARQIRDLYLRRQMIGMLTDAVSRAYAHDQETGADAMIERLEALLFTLAETGSASGYVPYGAALDEAIEQIEAAWRADGSIKGISSGLKAIDSIAGGFMAGDLIVLAGRPSMGKTALAENIAIAAARCGKTGCIFSMEMARRQLAMREIARETGERYDNLRRGILNRGGGSFDDLMRARENLAGLKLYIDDSPSLDVAAIRSRARRLKRSKGLDFAVIDYLQLGTSGGRAENRTQEVTAITKGLKAMAKELDIPVIALSQLSRACEAREDKRPQLSDLRESGSIEQDADIVIFLFREEYYIERREPSAADTAKHAQWQAELDAVRGIVEALVAKNRHGRVGKAVLSFDGPLMTFSDRAA